MHLPVVTSRAASEQHSEEEASKPEGLRVLVVDDNRAGADMLRLLIRSFGHEARTAYDGEEALQVTADYCPDLVLMDIGMPKMCGYEAAERIKRSNGHRSPYLVALTGWGQEEDRRRTREAGFDEHIVKPVESTVLKQLFAKLEPARP